VPKKGDSREVYQNGEATAWRPGSGGGLEVRDLLILLVRQGELWTMQHRPGYELEMGEE